MKKILFSLCVLFAVVSCYDNELALDSAVADNDLYGFIETLNATKTSMDQNNNVLWSEEDQLVAFMKTTLGVKYQIKEQYVGTTTGGFRKVVESGSGDDLESGQEIDHNVVLYPYSSDVWCVKNDNNNPAQSYKLNVVLPHTQVYAENTFSNGAFPMVAVSSNNQLTFRNVCGGMKLQFKGVDKIRSIKLEGLGQEPISGKSAVVGYVDGSAPTIVMDAAKAVGSITLDCGEEGVQLNMESPTTFIISVPPVVFRSGMKLTITDTDGMSQELKNTSSNTIKRSSLLTFPVITYKQGEVFELPDGALVSHEVLSEGGVIEIPVETNLDYKVIIPEEAKEWITLVDTKALRNETITLNIAENTTSKTRSAEVLIATTAGVQLQQVAISQKAASSALSLPHNEIWYTSADGKIVAPDNVGVNVFGANIKSNTYENGKGVITFDGDVTSIGESAFGHCTSLTSITIPSGVTTIGEYAFARCDKLARVTLPEGVSTIGGRAFYGCSSLTNINIPNGISNIAIETFYECKSLKTIIIPNSVKYIGYYAFQYCRALQNVTIGNSVEDIDNYAFDWCEALESITIPDSVTSIGYGAFRNCTSLKYVYCFPAIPPVLRNEYVFYNNAAGRTVYVRISSYDDYMEAPSWSGYTKIVKEDYTPVKCTDLTIEADDVPGYMTSATVRYKATTNGISFNRYIVNDVVITGEGVSSSFDVNTSLTNSVERTVSYTYLGKTATATITQGPSVPKKYTVDLNEDWQMSSAAPNPDPVLYDGVYESLNHGKRSSGYMYIDIQGYSDFSIYVRSDAESDYDYVTVWLDGTSVREVTDRNSDTSLSGYTKITYNDIDKGPHRISIRFKKDEDVNVGTDCGYVLIPKNQ